MPHIRSRHLLSLLALLLVLSACDEDEGSKDPGDVASDTAAEDTAAEDTAAEDSTETDSAAEDTTEDTAEDSASGDTSAGDVEDTSVPDTVAADTGATDGDVSTPSCDESGFTAANTRVIFEAEAVTLVGTSEVDSLDLFDALTIELRGGGESAVALDAPGTYALGSDADALDYATCDACVTFNIDCDVSGCGRYHLAEDGELAITELSAEGQPVKAELRGVVLREITFDSVGSNFVEGGATWCLDGITLTAP